MVEISLAHNKKLVLPSIKSRANFSSVYSGFKCVSDTSVLFSSRNIETPLLGLVASKKVGSAVYRNRAKRLMRAALISILQSRELTFTVILVARNTILDAPFEKIVNDLKYCIRKSEKALQVNG